jgi:hypothetical protein
MSGDILAAGAGGLRSGGAGAGGWAATYPKREDWAGRGEN